MASKFAVIVINEYLTVAAVVLPVVITLGVMARGGAGYWVNAVLVYLALPVIPLALVSLAVVAMMRFINISRKKDALILAGSLLLIGLSIVVQIGLRRSAGVDGGPGASAAAVAAFFTSPDSLLNKVGAIFPPGIWATKAIAGGFSGEGLANLALLLGVTIGLFFAMVVLAEKLFYRGLVGLAETTGRKRRLTRAEMSRRVSSGRRAGAAIFWREWKIMNRTPIFLLNGVLVSVFLPAVFILMATIDTGGKASGRGGDPMALLKALASANPLIVHPGGGAVHDHLRQHQRDGLIDVLAGRRAVLDLEGHPGRAPRAGGGQVPPLLLGGHAGRRHGRDRRRLFSASGGGGPYPRRPACPSSRGCSSRPSGMMIDLARPLLDWTNPQKAIKQNLNVLLALVADVGILTIAFFVVKALVKSKLAMGLVLGIVFAGFAALSAASYAALLKFADKRYPEIE